MSNAFALFTSDPNLLACELARLEEQVQLTDGASANAVGAATYAQDEVLMTRFPAHAFPRQLGQLVSAQHQSEALLFHAQPLMPEQSLEESTQPLRFRRWLFCQVGAVREFPHFRAKLLADLPEFLQRQVAGETEGEAAFALFLKHLRDVGRMEDRNLEAELAGKLLMDTARKLQELASGAGAARTSQVALIATNQRMLIAARSSDQPLYYTMLEGSNRCARCGIDARTPEVHPSVAAHMRRRSVAIASHLTKQASGWLEIPNGSVLAVDWKLRLRVMS